MATDPTPNAGATGVTGIRPIQTLAAPPQAIYPPDQLKAMREYGKYLMAGGGQQPVHHWTQGVSNMVSALLGGSMDRLAAQRQIAQEKLWNQMQPPPVGTAQPPAGATAPPTGATAPPAQVSSTEAGQPALGFTETASRGSDKAGSGGLDAGGAVKGSYFGNYKGKYNWVDKMDSGKQAGGQAVQNAPGIALPSRKTLGKLFDVTTPDGRMFTAKQTDLGPARWTKRGVDVNSALAEQMGYTPDRYKGPGRNPFPTDKHFAVRPHVEGQGDQRLLVQGSAGDAGDAGDGLAGRALAFNGEPVSSAFAPSMMPQGAGGQSAQPAGDQPAQAAGGQDPMVTALSGRAPAGGSPATIPPATAPGPGLVTTRPEISRETYINKMPWMGTSEEQQYFNNAYRMQNMPVAVPGMGGTWYVNPRDTSQRMWVPEIQKSEFGLGGGQTRPAPWYADPSGNIVPMEPKGGPPPSVTPASPGAPKPPITLGPQQDRPSPILPPNVSAAPFAEPGQGSMQQQMQKAGVPSEITAGPKGPQSMLTTQPPTMSDAEPGGLPAGTKPGSKLAFQPGQQPELPAGGTGWGPSPWRMTPEQQQGMGVQREINVEAGKEQAKKDAQEYSDWTSSTQRAVDSSYELLNRMQLAKKYVQDGRLLQGPGADTIKMPWNKFLAFFGDEKAASRVGISQAFDKLKSSNILSDLKQKLQGLGQIRLAEIALAAMSNIGRDNTPAANMAILNLGERLQWQVQKIGEIERAYDQGYRWDAKGNPLGKVGGQRSLMELHDVEMQFMRNNPIATDEDMDRLDHIFDLDTKTAGQKPTEKTTTQPKPITDDDRERLRKKIESRTKGQ